MSGAARASGSIRRCRVVAGPAISGVAEHGDEGGVSGAGEAERPPPRESVLESVKGFIDATLRSDLVAPTKQKRTIPKQRFG
ncbi:hypothetical protein [Streptomyces sp. AP-93]|uniref:hypothetical protein n=1 Tax=Streptomyces sp. AP-93 TaxID=2929048 RepID=UPI001FAFFD64|nr:hypothetical protein [Streptomyces sp. AP-93]MCJ0874664.1 hypothetical protein [Streptomyces sp. AP-93]